MRAWSEVRWLLWVTLWLASGCATDTSAREAWALVGHGALLVDVRSPSEFAERHPPQARNIPVEDLQRRLGEVRGHRVVVYCHTGARAGAATVILRRAGVEVHNLGSLAHWYGDPKRDVPLD